MVVLAPRRGYTHFNASLRRDHLSAYFAVLDCFYECCHAATSQISRIAALSNYWSGTVLNG